MELVEKKYRETPEGHKEQVKRLTEYISFLLQKGRIIEAKYFFNFLYQKKPNNIRTIRLGYTLSISLFDDEGVKKFDKLFSDSKVSDTDLTWFRLQYYYSRNDQKNAEDCCEFLLSKKLKKNQLNTIFEICMHLKSYIIAIHLIKYFKKRSLDFSKFGHKQIQKIILQRFIESILKAKHG